MAKDCKPWTEEEIKFLELNYPTKGVAGCVNFIKRAPKSISAKAARLNFYFVGKKPSRMENLEGQRFGLLTVKSLSNVDDKYNVIWNCKCECGTEKLIKSTHLKNGNTKSCGCYKNKFTSNRMYSGGKYLTGEEFSNIRQNASVRNINFNITIQDIEEIYEEQDKKCSLTGVDLVFNTTAVNGDQTKIGNKRIINGNASVDRINSNKGYEKNNIEILHKDINKAKWSKSKEEFIKLCCDVADYARNKSKNSKSIC